MSRRKWVVAESMLHQCDHFLGDRIRPEVPGLRDIARSGLAAISACIRRIQWKSDPTATVSSGSPMAKVFPGSKLCFGTHYPGESRLRALCCCVYFDLSASRVRIRTRFEYAALVGMECGRSWLRIRGRIVVACLDGSGRESRP